MQRNPASQPLRRGLALTLCAAGLLAAAAPAQALIFSARSSTTGMPGPGGDHVFSDRGAAPVTTDSSHFGHRSMPHNSGPLSAQTTSQAWSAASADMGGVHLRSEAAGVMV